MNARSVPVGTKLSSVHRSGRPLLLTYDWSELRSKVNAHKMNRENLERIFCSVIASVRCCLPISTQHVPGEYARKTGQ